GPEIDARAEILQKWLQKLTRAQQLLLKRCYADSNRSIQQIALEQKVTANSIYQKLKRLREILHACVDRHLASGGTTCLPMGPRRPPLAGCRKIRNCGNLLQPAVMEL